MPQYYYRARTADGKEVKGTLRAQSEERANVLLKSHSLTPLELRVADDTPLIYRRVFGGRVAARELILFSRQVSSMIRAGVPVLQSIQTLGRQVEKPSFAKLLREISYDIEGGESLSIAMAKQPDVFTSFFIGVVRTGEASGRLSESLAIMADYLEQNYYFVRKVRSALIYPIFVLVAVIFVAAIMFWFVMPQLTIIFTEANVALPLVTRLLIGLTAFMQQYWYVLAAAAVVLALLLRSYLKTAEGQYNLSTLALRLPVVKRLFSKVYLARLTAILHTLFSSDVPIVESLKLARESLSNRVYQRILDDTIVAVKDGAAISSVWEHEPEIPPMLTTMLGVGERSGEIDKVLREANTFFRRDVEEALDSITVLLEPLLVIVLGIGVGIVVAGVLLPIYNLVSVL